MHPALAQRVIHPYLQWRTGSQASPVLATLEQTQWWTPEQLAELQWTSLRDLLRHASVHVLYYRDLFGHLGAHPEDFRSPDDLRHLPVLTKETIRDRGADLVAQGTRPVRTWPTSGSTGVPIRASFDRHGDNWRQAAERRRMRWWGQDVGSRVATLSTHHYPRKYLWKRRLLLNEGHFFCVDLSAAELSRLHRELVRFRPESLRGRPSTLTHFARFVLDHGAGAAVLGLRVVWSSAEVLYPDQREVMARAFGCPVVDEYGSAENGLIAVECPEGRLHIVAENVYLEYRPVSPQGGEISEILVTNLRNRAMPFIRYAIGDLGGPVAAPCPCGRGLPLLGLAGGRTADVVVLPDGRFVDSTALVRTMEHLPRPIRQFRIIQEDPQRFTVLLAAEHGEGMAEVVRRDFHRILGFPASVDVRLVDEIPPEPTGKLRRFVSRLVHPAVRHRGEVPPRE